LVYRDHLGFVPALRLWHLAPWASAENLRSLAERKKYWKPSDIEEKRWNVFPPWFKSLCLYCLMQKPQFLTSSI